MHLVFLDPNEMVEATMAPDIRWQPEEPFMLDWWYVLKRSHKYLFEDKDYVFNKSILPNQGWFPPKSSC